MRTYDINLVRGCQIMLNRRRVKFGRRCDVFYFRTRKHFEPKDLHYKISEISRLAIKEMDTGLTNEEELKLDTLLKKYHFWLAGNDFILNFFRRFWYLGGSKNL